MHPVFLERQSKRSFLLEPVSESHVLEMLEAMRWAPSHKNIQPWRVVITNGPKLLPALSRGNAAWAPNAPLAFVMCGLPNPEAKPGKEHQFLFDVGLATENLILQATMLGYNTQPTGGWDEAMVKDMLKIPAEAKVVCIVFVGKPGKIEDLDERSREKAAKPRERRAIAETAFKEQWGMPIQ